MISKYGMILIVSALLFLSSCSGNNANGEVSCSDFSNAFMGLGHLDVWEITNFIEKKDLIMAQCESIFKNNLKEGSFCSKDETAYFDYCDMFIGFYSSDPKICVEAAESDAFASCLIGFSLNKNSDCGAFEGYSASLNGQDYPSSKMIDMCLLRKSQFFIDEKYCKQISDSSLKETCQKEVEGIKVLETYKKEGKCGDGVCEPPETNWNCPVDCETMDKSKLLENPPVCGDGICAKEEDCSVKLCTEGKEKCINSCPYSCARDCSVHERCLSDSDGGKDIYKKGTLNTTKYDIKPSDACMEKDDRGGFSMKTVCSGEKCFILEYYCTQEEVSEEFIGCPKGCNNGICSS